MPDLLPVAGVSDLVLVGASGFQHTDPSAGSWILWTFVGYIVAVFALGALAHRLLTRGNFVSEYFLGARGLGGWMLALTFAATAISGGTFLGFPSLIYTNGWSMSLWICSYMLSPLLGLALLGKRINHVGRVLGSITVPDLLRDRFQSRALGLFTTVTIIFFLSFNLWGQFIGGGLVMQTALGGTMRDGLGVPAERVYAVCVIVFAITVVAYTTFGGFWGVAFTDVLEGAVMFFGAVLLVPLVLHAAGGLAATTEKLAEIDPQLIYAPGPTGFLPITMAIAYFLHWPLAGTGQPSGMVRLMSFSDTGALKRALFVVTIYYAVVYISLLITFTAARAAFPTEFTGAGESDTVMPEVIVRTAPPWLAGILLAAPYAAIMSTVAAFLLMVSSGLVRDIYQRNINPDISESTTKRLSYLATAGVGVLATGLAFYRPDYLQIIILFTGAGLAATFLAPVALGLYWPRMTRAGALSAAIGGCATVLALYILGWMGFRSHVQFAATGFQPYYLLGFDPSLWGLAGSFVLGVVVSLCTEPPPAELVELVFGKAEETAARPQAARTPAG